MKKWIYRLLIVIFSLTLVISIGALAIHYISLSIQNSRYRELSQMMGQTTPRPTVDPTPDNTAVPTDPTEPPLVTVINPETGEEISLLPEFAQLYEMNPHIVGWIRIPGTDIDYPVMQTPQDQDYYLKRNFDREHSAQGSIYAREECDVFAPSDNITLYGHRMRDGSMFGQLDKYMDPEFCRENPYIYFDTLTGLHTYQILSVFLTTSSVDEGFHYHLFVDATDATEFDSFIATCKGLSLYDTGVDAVWGDKLITLSTCEYSQINGRLVIVAKRIG